MIVIIVIVFIRDLMIVTVIILVIGLSRVVGPFLSVVMMIICDFDYW